MTAVEEQVSWERRTGKLAAAAAFLSIGLSVASSIYVSSALDTEPAAGSTRDLLIARDAQPGVFTTGSAISGLSQLMLIGVLLYLFRATKLRRPEIPSAAFVLAIVGPILLAVAGILIQLDLIDKAHEFVQSGARTEARADDVVAERSALAQSVGLSGALALAFSTVLISQNAMRAGLLSRFIGILGIVVGAIYVIGALFPLGTDLVQLFWLLALGLIFLDRWPCGRGEAWEKGEAIEWPSSPQLRIAAIEAAGEDPEDRPGAIAPPSGDTDGEPAASRTRASRKRKRKRR